MYSKLTSNLEIEKAKQLADIEIEKFKQHFHAIEPNKRP